MMSDDMISEIEKIIKVKPKKKVRFSPEIIAYENLKYIRRLFL